MKDSVKAIITLGQWLQQAPGVCPHSGNVTDGDLHIDADQLDLGDEMRKRDKPDPTGVGAALRLHWQQCVQEETEKQLAAVSGGPVTGQQDCLLCARNPAHFNVHISTP